MGQPARVPDGWQALGRRVRWEGSGPGLRLLRYNTDGSLDTTFGTAGTGIVLYDNNGKKDEAVPSPCKPTARS